MSGNGFSAAKANAPTSPTPASRPLESAPSDTPIATITNKQSDGSRHSTSMDLFSLAGKSWKVRCASKVNTNSLLFQVFLHRSDIHWEVHFYSCRIMQQRSKASNGNDMEGVSVMLDQDQESASVTEGQQNVQQEAQQVTPQGSNQSGKVIKTIVLLPSQKGHCSQSHL